LKNTKIYQTLKDKENPDEVERHGPFICNWANSWLGAGYYFWDYFVENAHWWGNTHCKGRYMICEASIQLDSDNCFDLVDNFKHLDDLEKSINLMKENGVFQKGVTLSKVIGFMRDNDIFPNFSAIRANGINSKNELYKPNFRIYFENNNTYHYLNYKPEVQICIMKFENLDFKDFKIVYPDEYIDGYAV